MREANRSQQLCNTKIRSNNTSGIKGVCWDKAKQKWLVRVNKDKKNVYMARFDDLELAELVAIEARAKFHGEYAWL